MRKTTLIAAATALLLAGCSWGIKLDDAGRQVRTAWNGDVSACRQLGKVTVSVADHVGPVNRNDIKVRDELEVMARNEAAGMGADTVKPLAEPSDGSQAWGAYQCGNALKTSTPATPASQPAAPASGGAQTYPIDDH
jgi:hypothetical protein